jgi:hypothetical protein
MTEPLLVSKRTAATMLGISVRTLENLIAVREIIPRYIGKRCLIEVKKIEQFARFDHQTQKERKENNANQTLGLQRQR